MDFPNCTTASIQGLWRQLGCARRQAVPCSTPIPLDPFRAITGLPEILQAQILEFSGNEAASSLSLTSRGLHKCIWQSPQIWQARLAFIGATGNEGPEAELRDKYRWRLCGIDALCSSGVQPLATGDSVTVLEHARRAVKALVREDAPFLDLISMTLADLVRWYDYTDESAHRAAEALVQDVVARSYLFTSGHIRDLSSAYDSACSLRELLKIEEFDLAVTVDPDDDLTDGCLELLNRTQDFSDDSADIDCQIIPDSCEDEACDRLMELLRTLPDAL